MEQEQTVAFNLLRMFVGSDPPLFYLEIIVRIAIIYLYTLVLLRWLGSRTIAQLSTVEFLLVIALGSAVGDAMFYPEVPLLHALLVITGVVLLDKGIDRLIYRFTVLKAVVDGEPVEVIRNGIVNLQNLAKRDIAVDELHQMLRLSGSPIWARSTWASSSQADSSASSAPTSRERACPSCHLSIR
jgi:uncharacterized membrane protein YcaP (DUF421 family)